MCSHVVPPLLLIRTVPRGMLRFHGCQEMTFFQLITYTPLEKVTPENVPSIGWIQVEANLVSKVSFELITITRDIRETCDLSRDTDKPMAEQTSHEIALPDSGSSTNEQLENGHDEQIYRD